MLFNSIDFIIFFPVVIFLYFSIRPKYRWILLLIASYTFYMWWEIEYILLIITSTVIDYYVGLQINKTKNKQKKKSFLLLSILVNIGILFGFKYLNFISGSIQDLFIHWGYNIDTPFIDVLLPVGISFYTFQTLSYTLDVYKGKKEPEKHFGIFAVYVAFFPQLVAGPIERSHRLLPQFKKTNNFNEKNFLNGLKLMFWGFFKKLVIADNLAIIVNQVYSTPGEYNSLVLIIATIFFAYQIYCDFSGYSDIAIGSAKIMGYDLMQNFRTPYNSKTIREFWQRWHISLSLWFRDYLYIPLGGNKVPKIRWHYNILVVFVVSGLWHGANWTFVVWGFLHGMYLLIEHAIGLKEESNSAISKYAKVFYTFILVNVAWIFFRANNISDAWLIGENIIDFNLELSYLSKIITSRIEFISLIVSIFILEGIQQKAYDLKYPLSSIFVTNKVKRWALYIFLIIYFVNFARFQSAEQFIYFQF